MGVGKCTQAMGVGSAAFNAAVKFNAEKFNISTNKREVMSVDSSLGGDSLTSPISLDG